MFFLLSTIFWSGVSIPIFDRAMLQRSFPNDSPLVIAHRGASGHAPENTMAAIRLALDMKSDVIEIDVHLSKDKQVIVIHDATLDRTTTGSGSVDTYSLAELKELDAGSWMGDKFVGESIPTLEEVIEVVGEQSILLIEIKKGKKKRYEGLEQKVIDLVRKYRTENHTIIQSFQKKTIEKVIRLAPEIEAHKLIIGKLPIVSWHHDGKWQFYHPLKIEGVKAINPAFQFLTKSFVRNMRMADKKIFVYTVNTTEKMEKCMEMGVSGIITNYPDRLVELIGKRQNQ